MDPLYGTLDGDADKITVGALNVTNIVFDVVVPPGPLTVIV